MFYVGCVRAVYLEHPCRSALHRVRSTLRSMPFSWTLNPYTGCAHRCTFCYVRHFERRADRPGDDRYGREIRVKPNVAEVLRRELGGRSWRREEVAVGTATDPYQPCEGRYRLTRACIEALAGARTPFGIVTRGPLAWRDVDVLQEASRRARVTVSFSVPTLDHLVWRTTEPGTAPPASRLAIVERLAGAGIDVGVAVAPVLPGISDRPDQLAAVVRAAREAGARSIWCAVVNLRVGTREHFLEALARDWPEQVALYEDLFAGRSYLPASETDPILRRVRALADAWPAPPRPLLRAEPAPRQLTLAI